MLKWNENDYNEIVNGLDTYASILSLLHENGKVFIGWTDGTTHYDILFTYQAPNAGGHQRGIRSTDLFVSVMSWGSYGFDINTIKGRSYVAEKLFNGRIDSSVEQLSILIDNIISGLNALY